MPLKDLTLFGEIDKVQIAIDRLREFEPPEGYYLAFSGGKDSICIKHLADEANVKYDAHYNNTTVDPPELIRFIRKHYPDVEEHLPELSMWRLIVKRQMPPTRIVRYCCEQLKERGGIDRIVVTGIRSEESTKRSNRKLFETCFKHKTKHYLNPIIDWKEHEVWEYIKSRDLPYCSLYDCGYKRIGCIMCPMLNKKGMLKDAKRYPKYYNAYLRPFDKMLKARTEKGLKTEWETAEEVMRWWIYRKTKNHNTDQTIMFE